jgi:hypothetical protein
MKQAWKNCSRVVEGVRIRHHTSVIVPHFQARRLPHDQLWIGSSSLYDSTTSISTCTADHYLSRFSQRRTYDIGKRQYIVLESRYFPALRIISSRANRQTDWHWGCRRCGCWRRATTTTTTTITILLLHDG